MERSAARTELLLEAGNAFAFATGKEARAKEREAAKAWREGRTDNEPEVGAGGCEPNSVTP